MAMNERRKRLAWLGVMFVAATAELMVLPHRWHLTLIAVVGLVASVWGIRNELVAPVAQRSTRSRPVVEPPRPGGPATIVTGAGSTVNVGADPRRQAVDAQLACLLADLLALPEAPTARTATFEEAIQATARAGNRRGLVPRTWQRRPGGSASASEPPAVAVPGGSDGRAHDGPGPLHEMQSTRASGPARTVARFWELPAPAPPYRYAHRTRHTRPGTYHERQHR